MSVALLAVITCLGIPVLITLVAIFAERPVTAPKAPWLSRDSETLAGAVTFVLWAVLTVVGLAAVLLVDFWSLVASDRGEEIEHAFVFLTALAVPVSAMVIAVMVYSILRRGSGDEPDEDGPPSHGTGIFPKLWFVGTAALTVLIIIYPGLVTLDDVVDDHEQPELEIFVRAGQWDWLMDYPEQRLTDQFELVIPVDTKVTFYITSRDVAHSFWVPAFLMKIDTLPGHTTTLSLVAVEEGDYSDEPLYRLQCAELCGNNDDGSRGHGTMWAQVSVVSKAEFEEWVEAGGGPWPLPQQITGR